MATVANRRTSLFRHGLTAALALSAALSGCTRWHQLETAPDRVVMEKRPGAVRLTRSDGSRVVLLRPFMVRDSVVGDAEGAEQRTAVPRDSVTAVAVRQVNVALTVITIVAGLGLVFAALCLGVEGVCFPGS